MANATPRTPLTVGATYSWWTRLAMAPPSVVQRRGSYSTQDHWGTWIASPGDTVQTVITGVHQMLANEARVGVGHTTIVEFDLKS